MESDDKPRSASWDDLSTRQRRRRVGQSALSLTLRVGLLLTAYYVAPLEAAADDRVVLRMAVSIAAVGVTGVFATWTVLNAKYPLIRAFEAMSTLVCVALLVFASTFTIMSRSDPIAFSERLGHTDALYFTMTSMTTIGFGDITPQSEAARIAVMVQMVASAVLIGVGLRALANTAIRRAKTT